MTTDNIFGNDILSRDLNTSLVPELGQEDILLDITPSESSYADPLSQELSLTETEIAIDEIDIDNNSSSNNSQLVNNISVANIDPFIGGDAEEFQVNGIDVNDTSFAPPQSELEFQGGFGDYDGGNDVTLEIEDTNGNVVETFALSGEGQATLYRDEEYQYVFFSGVDETTKVDIDSTSNIKFGDYLGDSLEIQTTGSIDGGDIVLNEPNETGLVLKSGEESLGTNDSLPSRYEIINLGADLYPTDINELGHVVGNTPSTNNSGYFTLKGFIYNDSGLNYLEQYDYSTINAINNLGDIVGEYTNDVQQYSYENKFRPFYTVSGEHKTPEPTLASSYDGTGRDFLLDINNSGLIVGYAYNGNPNNSRYDIVTFEGDTSKSIHLGTRNRGYKVNDLNQILGNDLNDKQLFIYDNGEVTRIDKLPGRTSFESPVPFPGAINNLGEVVGTVLGSGYVYEGFIYSDGVIKNLGKDRISPYKIDINDLSQIVFTSSTTATSPSFYYQDTAFIYQNEELTNLNDLVDSNWNITSAEGINNNGQIVGQATFQGQNRGVILNPIQTPNDDYINIGNISTFGDTVVLQGNEITLTGNAITTNGGEITFDGATTVNGNLTIDSSVTEDEVITDGGNITFTGTVDADSAGTGNLRFQAGTNNILFEDTVGGEATFNNINVLGADLVTATADITSDQVIRINSTGDIVTQNITSENGRVVLSSEQKSISTLDITSGSEEGDNIVLQAGDSIDAVNLYSNELGIVKLVSGTYLEENPSVVGDITTASITGKRLKVESSGSFTASADILTNDGNVVVDAKQDITVENITADKGNVRLISEEKSVTTKDITSGSETEGGNIILEGVEGVRTDNLNAYELGIVKIESGEVSEGDTIVIGSTITDSITGKRVDVSSTGGFTAIGDIIAHDGRITVTTHDDIQTKKIESVTKSINLVSTDGEVTVDGELISGKGGIGIIAKDDITTQKIDSLDGVVGLSSFDGNVIVEDDITTVKGGVVIAGKAGVEVNDITTEVGEVSIGSSGDIDVNGRISTGTGYIDIKTNASISAQSATTNKGFVEIAAGGIATANIATGVGTSTLVSVANLDDEILIAGNPDGNLSSTVTSPQDLSDEEAAIFTEFVESVVYRARPLGELILGALYEWAYSNGDEIRGLMPGFLKLDEKEEARLNARLNQSKAFELGRLLGEGAAVAQGIYEFIVGSAAVGGGSGLCITGIGCFAGAPAIATGVVLQAHGGTLAVNSASEFGDKLRDILSPNRMASSGGADDVIGLSRETGISETSINKVYRDLGRNSNGDLGLDGSGIRGLNEKLGKNLAEHLFNKGDGGNTGSQLVKNVSTIVGKVLNDDVAIDSIKTAIRRNKNGKINDTQLNDAFSKAVDFSDQYKGKVSGDFPERFVRAEGKNTAQKLQAQSEIDLATDFLKEKTRLKGFDEVRGIPENTNNNGILTPDYKLIFKDDIIRLAELKAPNGDLTKNNLLRNLRKATNQLSTKESSYLNGYIRLDYSSSSKAIGRSEIATLIDEGLKETREIGKEANKRFIKGIDYTEFVEILYKNDSGQIENLLFQVKNEQVNIVP